MYICQIIVMEHLILAKVLHNLKKSSGDENICPASFHNTLEHMVSKDGC